MEWAGETGMMMLVAALMPGRNGSLRGKPFPFVIEATFVAFRPKLEAMIVPYLACYRSQEE